jgi:hypothetical protein
MNMTSTSRELNQPEMIRFRGILPLDGQSSSLADGLFKMIPLPLT